MKLKILLAALLGTLASGLGAQTVTTVVTGLFEPHSAAIVNEDDIYISDGANNRIVKFASSGKTTVLAGSGQPGSADGTGVLARFFQPQGLVAARGGLVVADSGNHTIRFISLNGVVTTLAGSAEGTGFEDGQGDQARFRYPLGLAADSAGNIYVADSKNNAIRRIDLNNMVTTVATGFFEPASVAVGDNGELWVADTRRHVIQRILPGGETSVIAGIWNQSGSTDAPIADSAQFSFPRGLLWLGGNVGLLVADSGNHTVRRLFWRSDLESWSVETMAGTPGQPGAEDGPAAEASFNSPAGLARDSINNGFLVVDRAGNSVRRIQTGPVQPPVSAPQIGWVDFIEDDFLGRRSILRPVQQATFNNDVIIAILSEQGTETYFTHGPTPPSHLEDNIPDPSRTSGTTPPPYRNGLLPHEVHPSMISPQPDVTIKAIGTQDGRRSSVIVTARFQFKAANPNISGDNAASFRLRNSTTGATMWYTTDGSEPSNDPAASPTSVGPISDNATISLFIEEETTFRVRAYRNGFKPSDIVTKVFSPTDFVANRISFGFDSGEASSEFIASAGQKFYAPVTLSVLPDQVMYSFQFNVTVGRESANADVAAGAVGFESMLQEFDSDRGLYFTIPPQMLESFTVITITNMFGEVIGEDLVLNYQDLLFTNSVDNLLGVGWIARSGLKKEVPNLFNVEEQDLITYSIAKDTVFHKDGQRIVLGAYHFRVPADAAPGSQYLIKLDRPSATSDGFGAPGSDVYIEAVTTGSKTAGSINAEKLVTVGQRKYIVGDVSPFRWLNAGDFGNATLLSADIAQVAQTVAYGLNAPMPGSDLEDAMDSCCDGYVVDAATGYFVRSGSLGSNALFDGGDLTINQIAFGDGQLDVRDVFVTFRRSLDPSLKWFQRFYTNGLLVAAFHDNGFRDQPQSMQVEDETTVMTSSASVGGDDGPPRVSFWIDDVAGSPGETISLPVRAEVFGGYALRVLAINLTVQPLDGSPPIAQAIQFTPGALGQPTISMANAPNNYSATWLNHSVTGLNGSGTIGTLQVKIPEEATANAAYRVHFDHLSASPNGLALFDSTDRSALLALSDRSDSSWGDGIPDSWRLRHFGSIANLLSHADADADGDGMTNREEYVAGTDPNDVKSALRLRSELKNSPGLVLRWPSVDGKSYTIESASSLGSEQWTTLATDIPGNGSELQFLDSEVAPGSRFYRVRVQP